MKVVQLIDTLNAGGAERMAVNYANMLAKAHGASYLVTTRSSGILSDDLNEDVVHLNLQKAKTFDWKAIKKFKQFIKQNEVKIVHAHTTSYFFAVLTKLIYPKLRIVWHDHHGNRLQASASKQLPLMLSSVLFNGVICVNEDILKWANKNLHCKNTIYLPNFIYNDSKAKGKTKLPGSDGKRIIKVANLRNPKNHLVLLKAFKSIHALHSDWTLHLVGNVKENEYSRQLKDFIKDNQLESSIYVHGLKDDISYILSQCEIGVIASTSEGLPMALLEYGHAALSVITTNVGKCGDIVGARGVVLQEISQNEMEKAILMLIDNDELRSRYSKEIKDYIDANFSEKAILEKVNRFYESVI